MDEPVKKTRKSPKTKKRFHLSADKHDILVRQRLYQGHESSGFRVIKKPIENEEY